MVAFPLLTGLALTLASPEFQTVLDAAKNAELNRVATELNSTCAERDRSTTGRVDGNSRPEPNGANPPQNYVRGMIEKVDETGLVLLSVGTDAGVNVNNTLDAFRTRPKAEYLGMIRIVDANHHKAVGRLMRVGRPMGSPVPDQPPTLRAGDEVVSSLQPHHLAGGR